MSINSILNYVSGNKNIFLQDSNNNIIVIGNITYDNAKKKRTVKCLLCKTPAEDSTKEEEIDYTAFTCINCGHRFYELDKMADNISSYIDLSYQEGKEFKRLIEAVNHDLHIGEVITAYNRCKTNKEIYGRTAQMYEWGAFTLFLSKPIDYWIDNSLRGVIAYLKMSKQLNPKSETYNEIASSIATRYFRAIMSRIEKIKEKTSKKSILTEAEMFYEDKKGKQDAHKDELIFSRQEIFKYLLQMGECFNVYPNADFLKYALTELYGYGQMAWFKRKFVSFFRQPEDDITGEIKQLKGYMWDFHKVVSNCEYVFENYNETPASYTVKIEALLKNHTPNQEFSEIRVGDVFNESPLSPSASLMIWQFRIWGLLFLGLGMIIILSINRPIFLYPLSSIYIGLTLCFLYYKDKDHNIPDSLRRLTNKYTNRF